MDSSFLNLMKTKMETNLNEKDFADLVIDFIKAVFANEKNTKAETAPEEIRSETAED